ncbi:MAG: alcohol dehydrogenase catalytic domain-containing protein [Candidatus Bathyarchaeota archaeon]|nr:MAG: alcohol dehydrogenase catalytic domain-containing protein [Candidatus Bathyarchaeota archaeon]
MKAVIKRRPEPGVEVFDVPVPDVGAGEVLIRVRAAAICGSDLGIFKYTPAYSKMKLPVVLGHEFAGEIVEVGEGVVGFDVGDRVLSESVKACGSCRFCREGMTNLCEDSTLFGIHTDGGFSEYVAVPHTLLHDIPEGMTFEVAAVVEPLSNALHFVKDITPIGRGDFVVVHGIGPIGLFSAQLFRISEARVLITGIGVDTERFKIAERLGFESVNVEGEDLIERVMDMTDGGGADIAFVAVGAGSALHQALQVVRKKGHVTVVGIFPGMVELPITDMVRREITLAGAYDAKPINFEESIELLMSGAINAEEIITHRFSLDEAEEAFRVADSKRGGKILFVND